MEPLTREMLLSMILRAGKEPSTVSLYGSHGNEGLVIDHRPGGWVVFYTQRGGESDLTKHLSEHAACLNVLERLGFGA